MAIIHDLLELDSAPGVGDTLGVAGSGADVTLLGTETEATVADDSYDSSGGLFHEAGLHHGSSGTNPTEIDSISHDVTTIREVTYDLGGVTYTGHVIDVVPTAGGATRFFLLPEDGSDPVLGVVTILTSTTVYFVDADDAAIDDTVTFPTCFLAGTRISTPSGPRPVERLKVGDPVCTLDDGDQPVLWIGETIVPLARARADPKLCPVEIPADSFGPGLPERAVNLSRQHRVLVQSRIVARMFGSPEALVAAKHFEAAGIARAPPPEGDLVYRHLLLARHSILLVDGLRAESLWLGPQAARSLGQAALHAAQSCLARANLPLADGPARQIAGGQRAKTLLARHRRNRRPLDEGGSGQLVAAASGAFDRPGFGQGDRP